MDDLNEEGFPLMSEPTSVVPLVFFPGRGLSKNHKYYLFNSFETILDSRSCTCQNSEVGGTLSCSKFNKRISVFRSLYVGKYMP